MEVVQLAADLYFFRMPIGHVYLWRDPDGLTLIDAGAPGCAPPIADAIGDLGMTLTDVRRLVLTHGHVDHIGAAAEIASWGQVIVLAHRAEAHVIRGQAAGPPPKLADWERPIFARVSAQLPAGPPAPVRVDHELDDGDVIDFGGGAVTMAVPGHTAGSIALYLPQPRVLFTGDIMARDPQTRDPQSPVIPGVSTPTLRRCLTPSGGWRPWMPRSPVSATVNRLRSEPRSEYRPPLNSYSPRRAGWHQAIATPRHPALTAPSRPRHTLDNRRRLRSNL